MVRDNTGHLEVQMPQIAQVRDLDLEDSLDIALAPSSGNYSTSQALGH